MKVKLLLLTCLLALVAAGCADKNTLTDVSRSLSDYGPAGFWRGLWHGLCAPFAFIGIMFGLDVGVYEAFNTGNWYNFGFLLGVGGLGAGSSSKK